MGNGNDEHESFTTCTVFDLVHKVCDIYDYVWRFLPVWYKNSSGDEIANVNFFYNIAHVEASAYAH